MESNRYYQHRQEIKAVCEDLDVPVDIGTDIVRRKYGWSMIGTAGTELQQWRKICREYQLDKEKSLKDLFND